MHMHDPAACSSAEVDQTERIRLLYEGSRLALLLMALSSLVFLFVLWDTGPAPMLMAWSGWTLLLALFRLHQSHTFTKASAEEQQQAHWLRSFLVANTLSALTLCYAFLELAISGPFLQQTVLLGSLASVVVAGGVA